MNSLKPIKNFETTLQYNNMNSAPYQNDQVDWGLLAKQWIQMAELVPPAAPRYIKDFGEEKGEAPMEVERDDELQTTGTTTDTSSWLTPGWNQPFPNQGQWLQGSNEWTNRNTVPALHQLRPPLLPQPNSFPTFNTANLSSPDYWTHKPRFPVTEVQSSKNDLRTEIIDNEEDMDEDTTQTIDAAKRKILPAWLREGLEKMEREKQKQEEKEKEIREREIALMQRRIEEEEAIKELEKDSLIPTKSKFESDSDEIEDDIEKKVPAKELKAKFEQKIGKKDKPEEKKLSKSPELYRTREEIIQDLMLSVRKNLTEILLEVTNEEILELAKESLTKARKKAPTALRKTALTSLTGGLGLGIYANSTDESDSSSDDDGANKTNNIDDNDSEQELQEMIKRRKAAFEKISREIEAQIAEEDEREERRRREREQDNHGNEDKLDDDGRRRNHHGSGSSVGGVSNDYRDGEAQLHDKNNMKYGRSAREKKPTRFSDPRDTVKNVQTHVSIVTTNKSTNKNEIDSKAPIISYNRRSCDTSNSSSEQSPINSRQKKIKKSKKSSHKRKRTKYDNSDSDDSTNDDNRSVFSTTSNKLQIRRSKSRDHYSRSEDSRSSYNRRDRTRSRSRNRDNHHHRHKRETTRDYYDDRSRSQDKKRKTKSRSKERYHSKSSNKDRSVSRSKDRHTSSSRHRY